MLVGITITGQIEIDEGDIKKLETETISTLGAVLQNQGKNIKVRVAEVYEKLDKTGGK